MTTNGVEPTAMSRMRLPRAMPWMTKRLMPTGGVMKPISSHTIMTMPNHTGSKPSPVTSGNRIGSMMIITDSSSSA